MAKMSEGRASAIEADGVLLNMPGFSGGKQMDKLPILIPSPILTTHTAQSSEGVFVAPCDMTIVGIAANVIEASGTAAGTITVGTVADPDAFVNDYSVATDASTGFVDIIDDDTVVGTSISQGDVIVFGSNGEATTTGQIALTLVCIPR